MRKIKNAVILVVFLLILVFFLYETLSILIDGKSYVVLYDIDINNEHFFYRSLFRLRLYFVVITFILLVQVVLTIMLLYNEQAQNLIVFRRVLSLLLTLWIIYQIVTWAAAGFDH